MKPTLIKIAMAAAVSLHALVGSLVAQSPVRICVLGDSILESFTGKASTRYYLDQLLRADSYDFDFVGSLSGVFAGPPLHTTGWDQDHECHSGFRVDDILPDLLTFMQAARPDIVIIHLGTNDVIRNQPATNTVAELEQCIDIVRSQNPIATVLLSQIIPIAGRNVAPLNALMPAMVAAKDAPESRIVLVDQFSQFDPMTHLEDGLHPNDAGEQLMAQTYFDALVDFLSPSSLRVSAFGNGCVGGSISVEPTFKEIRGQAASLGNTYTTIFENIPPGASTFGFLGFSQVDFFGTPLPLDLSLVGATGCTLYVGPELTRPLPNAGGSTMWTLAVPPDQALVGNSFFQQVIVVQPGVNPLGMVFSDAAMVTVVEG